MPPTLTAIARSGSASDWPLRTAARCQIVVTSGGTAARRTPASATLPITDTTRESVDGAGDLVDADDARRRGTARAREQGLNETRAEEAGTAGDENGHRVGSPA